MNHHIHPLENAETGERRSLPSCRPKGAGHSKKAKDSNACKGGFPLDQQLTETPLLVCECIAAERGLPTRGPKRMLGVVLPARNSAWLNAGPRAYIVFCADNADIKFPHRLPILEESHEVLLYDLQRRSCTKHNDAVTQAYDMQAGMAAAAGYFGGYMSI